VLAPGLLAMARRVISQDASAAALTYLNLVRERRGVRHALHADDHRAGGIAPHRRPHGLGQGVCGNGLLDLDRLATEAVDQIAPYRTVLAFQFIDDFPELPADVEDRGMGVRVAKRGLDRRRERGRVLGHGGRGVGSQHQYREKHSRISAVHSDSQEGAPVRTRT